MLAPRRLSAVVFDFDGTLARPALDFPLMKRRVAELAASRLGRAPSPDGLPALEWIEHLSGLMAPPDAAGFREDAHALIRDMEAEAAARTTLFPFARPVLTRLRAGGVAPAVITRNTRLSVETVFPDAPGFVAVVLAREDVDRVKPHPSHLLEALARLRVEPRSALMVGDHPTDVLTARNAGTLAGAVASGGTPEVVLRQAGPDFFASDAGELTDRLEAEGWL